MLGPFPNSEEMFELIKELAAEKEVSTGFQTDVIPDAEWMAKILKNLKPDKCKDLLKKKANPINA